MKRMWAPWRKTYLRSSQPKNSSNLFSRLLREKSDKKNLVLIRTPHHFALLNRYPYTNGHVMIVPNRKIQDFSQMTKEEILDAFGLLVRIQKALKKILKAHGFNIGINLGDIAGAGIPKHLHWHIVPRWKGDVNFMPVIAETKVISESLESVYLALNKVLSGSPKKRRGRK